MTSKFLAVALTGAMALGAVAAGPGENGQNGLCTAYFNGQKNGHDNPNAGNENGNGRQPNEAPGPFNTLEEAAGEYAGNDGYDNDGDGEVDEEGESNGSVSEDVFAYCNDMFGEVGGNPANGRFGECTITDDNESDPPTREVECEDPENEEQKSNGGPKDRNENAPDKGGN